jgi:nucleoredoxin
MLNFLGSSFTPNLGDFYNEVNSGDLIFEIVYVNFDHEKEEFDATRNQMPWISIPYGDKRNKELVKKYNIIGIPHLVVLKEDGELFMQNARMDVQAKGYNVFDEWLIKANKPKEELKQNK